MIKKYHIFFHCIPKIYILEKKKSKWIKLSSRVLCSSVNFTDYCVGIRTALSDKADIPRVSFNPQLWHLSDGAFTSSTHLTEHCYMLLSTKITWLCTWLLTYLGMDGRTIKANHMIHYLQNVCLCRRRCSQRVVLFESYWLYILANSSKYFRNNHYV